MGARALSESDVAAHPMSLSTQRGRQGVESMVDAAAGAFVSIVVCVPTMIADQQPLKSAIYRALPAR